MPQVDLETLVCGGGGLTGGDGKVSCETLIQPDPSLPPESISVSIQDYLAGAAPLIYDRDDSTKESTNPKSQSHNPNPAVPNPTRSGSQRYASANLKANGPIIGLPNKIKHVTCSTSRHRSPQTSSRIFPKKKPAKAAGGKSAVPEYEPSSPKVSCIGKVLSDREREKCRLAHHRQSPESSGCWDGFVGLFSCGGGGAGRERGVEAIEEKDVVGARGNILVKKRNIPSDEDGDVEVGSNGSVPGLGGMKRFASGRRAASWGGDGEEDGHVAVDLSRRSLDAGPIEV